ncbi:MAG: UDP-N-acetylmuramate--L-alanine ligase [Candidatus Nealsonbacteria bacterium CG_4_10_14_0_8_um_filter_37_14]|uniref:UDP-N-acetylmuramate--L-alanine ligase n=1 Tax=Candidatus Nealsonbacteria bacterium CG_4_10_14_0_8_um_filter_37_14 TaxID=1974684 RepID=A0A2M7R699_9BACT|nr:MAG: UDP-N-acetylmuramate--L-alanine ligase [Candidatus Nealsonbacteria bacterium CG_4_10_14_0_8_um_filter_37_14]
MKVHFIGIGGIGVSALAQYYLEKGHQVSGSDLNSSEITEFLRVKGARIYIGPQLARTVLANIDLVIYSPAVQKNNPELMAAKKLGIKCQSYPKALGELTKKYFTIAVSGTHGKSTTTAMIALILIRAGLDPTVIVGTKLKEFKNSNCRVGKSNYLVIEADEHFASFLNYWPKIIVLTNIEADHLDYYKNLQNLLKTFKEYISHSSKDGVLIFNKNDKNILEITKNYIGDTYGFSGKQNEAKKIKNILKIPGEHNVYNALAALTLARVLKIPDKVTYKTLSEYKGAWRRFEIKNVKLYENTSCSITVVSDYGHHPTQIRATLKAAREKWPKRKIWLVFQPHQHQRTFYLFKDFVMVFKKALLKHWVNKCIITDIYGVAGREKKEIRKKVNSEKLVKAINKKDAIYLPKQKILNYLKKNLGGGEVVIIMGAGDIYKLTL